MYATVAGVLLGSSNALRDPSMDPKAKLPETHVRATPEDRLAQQQVGVTASGALQTGEHTDLTSSAGKFVVGSDGEFWADESEAPDYDSIEVHELTAKGDPHG